MYEILDDVNFWTLHKSIKIKFRIYSIFKERFTPGDLQQGYICWQCLLTLLLIFCDLNKPNTVDNLDVNEFLASSIMHAYKRHYETCNKMTSHFFFVLY